MAFPGDETKRPPECQKLKDKAECANMLCTYEGWDGERYRCAICGASYFLHYDDMK